MNVVGAIITVMQVVSTGVNFSFWMRPQGEFLILELQIEHETTIIIEKLTFLCLWRNDYFSVHEGEILHKKS